jgi:hypothetical protein
VATWTDFTVFYSGYVIIKDLLICCYFLSDCSWAPAVVSALHFQNSTKWIMEKKFKLALSVF